MASSWLERPWKEKGKGERSVPGLSFANQPNWNREELQAQSSNALLIPAAWYATTAPGFLLPWLQEL